jgi:serine/threonine-protein phosphatase 6 regulatory ankyrin repeat subunit A/serine/threonine-protein phosphatase 6 regulatory ankyrin repeat subunit B
MTLLNMAMKEVLRIPLKYGADIDPRTDNGQTPLHLASQHDRKKITEILLKEGADNATDKDQQQTALHIVARYDYEDITEKRTKAQR